jgi:predicted permease
LIALFTLFLNNLLPIFLIAGAGFILGRQLQVNPRTLSQVSFYFFSPCLVFQLLIQNQLSNSDIARMMGFTATTTLLVGLIAWSASRVLKFERRLLAAVVIAAMFMNAGNLGLPLNLFAFGETALTQASLFFVTQSILTNTIGIVIASLGSSSLKQALLGMLKIPAVYALALGLLVARQGWHLPTFLERATTLAGNAAIPSILVLLGLQLQRTHWTGQILALTLTSVIRLLAAPALALGLCGVFGLQGVARQAGVLESAMPTAVLSTVLATEYDVEPTFVTSVVFITTLLSPLTLTPLLAYLGG